MSEFSAELALVRRVPLVQQGTRRIVARVGGSGIGAAMGRSFASCGWI